MYFYFLRIQGKSKIQESTPYSQTDFGSKNSTYLKYYEKDGQAGQICLFGGESGEMKMVIA